MAWCELCDDCTKEELVGCLRTGVCKWRHVYIENSCTIQLSEDPPVSVGE